MPDKDKKPTPTSQQSPERSVRFNGTEATFKDADKIPGSRLAPGTDLHIFYNSAECGDGMYIEFVTRGTKRGQFIGDLSCGDIVGDHKDFYSAQRADAIAARRTTLKFKGSTDSIGTAIQDALDRASGDSKLTATEVMQFERAASMIRTAATTGGEITSAETANILAHLKKIAPKQKPPAR